MKNTDSSKQHPKMVINTSCPDADEGESQANITHNEDPDSENNDNRSRASSMVSVHLTPVKSKECNPFDDSAVPDLFFQKLPPVLNQNTNSSQTNSYIFKDANETTPLKEKTKRCCCTIG